jgi:dihydropteroate synthase-like protein
MSGLTLFLTGHLAEKRLGRVLAAIADLEFPWRVQDIGIQVAALMTTDLIRRRLPREGLDAERVVVPGHCRGDLSALNEEFGIPFERGPEDLHDLPAYFGREGETIDLAQHNVRIFAEIVDAPSLSLDAILARARRFAADGADVIDLGCLPDTPFPHLEEAVIALRENGFAVSVDSAEREELRRGGKAGADFVLSLNEDTLALAEEIAAVPVIIPARSGDLDSLCRAAERLAKSGKPFIADTVLDPIPFGFTASLLRYAELRRRLPEARILMGIGNLTELTDADTTGVNALLFGLIAELDITDVLAVQVSPHCRRAIAEADRSRRLMHAAKRLNRLPVGIDQSLMALRDRKPFASRPDEIVELAAALRDRNFRIEIAEDGIHVYNRDGHWVHRDAFDFFEKLGVAEDGAHAFYLGVELARAQTAWQLGKRYVQDQDLDWKSATDRPAAPPPGTHRAPGPTLQARRKRRGTEP